MSNEGSGRLDSDVRRRLEGIVHAEDGDLDEWAASYLDSHERYYRYLLDRIGDYEPHTVLEVGAAPFQLTAILDATYDLVALDLEPDRFSAIIDEFDLAVEPCDIEREQFPLDEDSVDLVLFTEVFEHLRIDPIHTLREIHRVLEPGGVLIMSTPNLYSLAGIYDFLRGAGLNDPYDEFEKLETVGHMGHVRLYSNDEIERFLSKTGFVVTDVDFRNFGEAPGVDKPVIGYGIRLLYRLVPRLRNVQFVTAIKE